MANVSCLVTAARTALLFYRQALNVNDQVTAESHRMDIEMIRSSLQAFGLKSKVSQRIPAMRGRVVLTPDWQSPCPTARILRRPCSRARLPKASSALPDAPTRWRARTHAQRKLRPMRNQCVEHQARLLAPMAGYSRQLDRRCQRYQRSVTIRLDTRYTWKRLACGKWSGKHRPVQRKWEFRG